MKKYALLFAGNVFEDSEIRPLDTLPDLCFWKEKLIEKHGYDPNDISSFSSSDFTTQQLVVQLFLMAATLKEGDYLTIIISSHGSFETLNGVRKTYIVTYDTFVTENVLFYLLRLFHPDTQVAVITDCCYTGDMLTKKSITLDEDDYKSIRYAVSGLPIELAQKISNLFELCAETGMPNKTWHIASSYTTSVIKDGFFRQLNKALYGRLGEDEMLSVPQYRHTLNKFTYNSVGNFYREEIDKLCTRDPKGFIQNLFMKDTGKNIDKHDDVDLLIITENKFLRKRLERGIKTVMDGNYYNDNEKIMLEVSYDMICFYNMVFQFEYPQLSVHGQHTLESIKDTITFEK